MFIDSAPYGIIAAEFHTGVLSDDNVSMELKFLLDLWRSRS